MRKVEIQTVLLTTACIITIAVYWIGLRGPFLFDDGPNFSIVRLWHEGKATFAEVLFPHTSFLTHRSLAMASFALNTWAFGYTPFGFKLGNLALHLACGLVAYGLMTKLLQRDPVLGPKARLVSALIIAVWLLHPLHASTVLYAVQRMAQIATLFSLLGLWLYIRVRNDMEAGNSRFAWLWLFGGIPILMVLGMQGKQNAVILPALCLVVELAYFSWPRRWNLLLATFYSVFIALPALALVAGVLSHADFLYRGYIDYPFTMWERLISEARVLCDYLLMLIAPYSPEMGVYTDDYKASAGLLSPPSTLIAIIALIAVSLTAVRLRKSSPSIFAGWFLFLVGHAVEGTVIPIELYYEHRNYFPALGVFLAGAAAIAAAGTFLAYRGIRVGRIGAVTATALFLVLALQTHGRARVWSDLYVLAESALQSHPNSVRAAVNYLGLAMESGDSERAYAALAEINSSATDPKVLGLTALFAIRMDCGSKGIASPEQLDRAVSLLPPHIDLSTVQIMGHTRHLIERQGCPGISRSRFASAIDHTVDRAINQPDDAWVKWVLRYRAAALYAADGEWPVALEQARLAWQPSAPSAAAELLVDIYLQQNMLSEAQRTFVEATSRTRTGSDEETQLLARMRDKIALVAAGEDFAGPFAWDMDVQ